MTEIPLYIIDAFTRKIFGGNPAAVCPLDAWLSDEQLQLIALENNLSETAFFVKRGDVYELRWFTPQVEMDLCGHATLAAAFVIFSYLDYDRDQIVFKTRVSGTLVVKRGGEDRLTMDFPAREAAPCAAPGDLLQGLKKKPREVLLARDYLAVYDSEEEIRALDPDLSALVKLDSVGVIATAPGRASDFVSRFFAPRAGIPEDPVTGSAHSTLIPYWAKKLAKRELHAYQVSPRGGELFCEHLGARVLISGHAVRYSEGTLYLP